MWSQALANPAPVEPWQYLYLFFVACSLPLFAFAYAVDNIYNWHKLPKTMRLFTVLGMLEFYLSVRLMILPVVFAPWIVIQSAPWGARLIASLFLLTGHLAVISVFILPRINTNNRV